jgi:hypothetical protein
MRSALPQRVKRRSRLSLEPLEDRCLLSLVAAYSFAEGSGTTVADSSGNGNTATISNATWAQGKYGGGLKFTGATNSFASIADVPALDLTNALTLEAWVNPSTLNSPDSNWVAAVAKDHPNSVNDISYALYAATGTSTPPAEHLLVGNSDIGASGTTKLTLNTWTFLSTTYDGSSMKVYVNGTLVRTVTQSGSIAEVAAPLKLGGDWSGEMFTGILDEVRVYNSALTQTQIQTDMNTPIDNIPPTVSLTAPSGGATVSGSSVIVSANASDNIAVANVQFLLDGATLGGPVSTAPYQITWNSTTALNGQHTLTAKATDTAGNSTISAPVTVTVSNLDTTPPTVSFISPGNGATVAGTTNLSVTASDNQAVASVQFQIDGTNFGSPIMSSPYTASWDSTSVSNGPHTITAIATDASNNQASATITVTVNQTTDTVPPTVSLTAPANNSMLAGTLTFSANASDNVAVANILFSVDGTPVGNPVTTAPYQVTWDSSKLPDGTHTIAAKATDPSGNSATSSVTIRTVNGGIFGGVINTPVNPFDNLPLVAVNMVLLDNGKVLMWDGGPTCIGAVSPTVWDPVAGTFTPVPLETQPELRDIFCSAQTALADGRILVVGGHDCTSTTFIGQSIANVFDPATNTWTFYPDMHDRRWYPGAITLPNGTALVLAGSATSNTDYDPIPEQYDPVSNTWTRLTGANQVIANYPFAFVLPDGRVFAGGSDEAKMASYVLNVATQTWSVVDPTILDGGSAVQYLPGKIMKAGSSYLSPPADNGGSVPSTATTYVIDMNQQSPAWHQTASMAYARTHLNLTILPDDTVLATGGSSDIGGVNPAKAVYPAELWSPVTQTWTTMASMVTPRLYHSTAVLLPDGTVAVAGGGRNFFNDIAYPSIEIYSPAYLFKGPRPTITAAPTTLAYGQSFFVGTPNPANIATVTLIHNGSDTHAFNMDQSYVPLSFTQTSGGLTVQAPANSNLAVPGYYMLFIVDKNGVPSIAPFVRLPAPYEDTQAPTAPTNLRANGTISSVSLVWAASTDNVGVTGYSIYRSTVSGFTPSSATLIGTSTTTSYTDHVSAGTYYYLVTAGDAAGNVSLPSNQATLTVTAIQLIQAATTGNEATGAQISVAFPANVTAGDFLIITGTAARPRTTITISDTAGNTFVPAISGVSDPAQDVTAYIWYVVNAKGGADTVTLTPNGFGDALEIHVSEWVGISQVSPLDQTASATGIGTLASSGAKTTTSNGELIFGYTFLNQNATAGAGFTGLSLINGDLDEYQFQTVAGSVATTFTQTSDTWLALMATFRPNGSPDVTPPTPPSNLTATNGLLGTVNLSWTASTDDVGVTGYSIYRSTTSGFTPSSATLIGTSTTASYSDQVAAGSYYYLVTARDAAGNVSQPSNEATGTSAADTVPPTVSIIAPASGASVSGTVAVSASASDNVGVASVQFVLDNVNFGAPLTAAPYSFSWNSATVVNGTHTWAAIARDASGNSTTSATITFTVNNSAIPGLIASYGLDEGTGTVVNDSSTNHNNGTLTNATWTIGHFGNALKFTGATNSLVTINSSTSLNATTGLTVEAWVNPSTLTSPDGNWVAAVAKEHRNSSNDIAYALYAATGTSTPPALHLLIGGTDVGVSGTSVLPLNTWTFLVGTYDGATMKLYVNGTLVGSKAKTGTITTTADPLRIGGDWSGEMFTGIIDNVRIYNRALIASDIQTDMNTPISARPLVAPAAGQTSSHNGLLSEAMLLAVAREAIARWAAAGASADQLQLLRGVQLQVENLPSPYLGLDVGNEVFISRNAAGYGWFTNPGDDRAFALHHVHRMDLLTTVMHEFGHVLGIDDNNPNSAMTETLLPGVRLNPSAVDLLTIAGPAK